MAGPSEVRIGSELEEFPGRSFNLMVREWYRQHAQLGRGGSKVSGPGQFIIAKARNTTGQTLQYGAAVALEGLAIPYANQDGQQYKRPLLKAQFNSDSLHHSIMGVAMTTTEDGQPGPFIIGGLAWVRCNFTDEGHHSVKLEDTQEEPVAVSSGSGLPILDSEPVPDAEYLPAELWCLVLLGGGGGGGTINFSRAASVGIIDPAEDWGVDDAGQGQAAYVADDGSFSEPFDVLSNYFDEIADNVPGWVYEDSEGRFWFVNAGCTPGPD